MRALLPRVSIVVSAILVMGAGLALAATPSRPGMFLYPVRQLTRSITDYFVETVVIGVPALVRGEPEPGPAATATSLPMIVEEAAMEPEPAVDAVDTVAESPPQPTVAAGRVQPDPALLVKTDATPPVVLAADPTSAPNDAGAALSQQEPVVFVEQKIEKTSAGSGQNGGSGDRGRPYSDSRSDDDDKDHEGE
jgi:hypothetical protein